MQPGQIIRTEHPVPTVPVVIYRDKHDVPHIYGATNAALAFGAGYAQAQDRLFLMDVLRHYGGGNARPPSSAPPAPTSRWTTTSCCCAPYTTAQANAQVNNLPKEYGAQGGWRWR